MAHLGSNGQQFDFLAIRTNVLDPNLRGNLKKNIIFKYIIQIEVDPPHSHPIFNKFIFDKVLVMLISLPPLEFLIKIMAF